MRLHEPSLERLQRTGVITIDGDGRVLLMVENKRWDIGSVESKERVKREFESSCIESVRSLLTRTPSLLHSRQGKTDSN